MAIQFYWEKLAGPELVFCPQHQLQLITFDTHNLLSLYIIYFGASLHGGWSTKSKSIMYTFYLQEKGAANIYSVLEDFEPYNFDFVYSYSSVFDTTSDEYSVHVNRLLRYYEDDKWFDCDVASYVHGSSSEHIPFNSRFDAIRLGLNTGVFPSVRVGRQRVSFPYNIDIWSLNNYIIANKQIYHPNSFPNGPDDSLKCFIKPKNPPPAPKRRRLPSKTLRVLQEKLIEETIATANNLDDLLSLDCVSYGCYENPRGVCIEQSDFGDVAFGASIVCSFLYKVSHNDTIIRTLAFTDLITAIMGYFRGTSVKCEDIITYFSGYTDDVMSHADIFRRFFVRKSGQTVAQSNFDFNISTDISEYLSLIFGNLTSDVCTSVIYIFTFVLGSIAALCAGTVPDFSTLSRDCHLYASKITYDSNTFTHVYKAISIIRDYVLSIRSAFDVGDTFAQCYLTGQKILTYQSVDRLLEDKQFTEFLDLSDIYQDLYKRFSAIRPLHVPGKYDGKWFGNIIDGCGEARVNAIMITRINNSHIKVMDKINAGIAILQSPGIRKCPFSLILYGGSSVGKSNVCGLINNYLCRVMDYPTDPRFTYTFAPGHKFMDGYKPYHVTCILDDVGAVRKECQDGADAMVTETLRMINNMAFMTDQAAIEAKASTPFLSKILLATTNSATLRASDYMHYEAVILRRFNYRITVSVKTEFAINGALNQELAARWTNDHPGELPNFWNFTVEKYYVDNTDDGRISGSFRAIQENGTLYSGIDIYCLFDFLKDKVQQFDVTQDLAIKPPIFNMCPHCKYVRCRCMLSNVQIQSEYDTYSELSYILIFSIIVYIFVSLYRIVSYYIRLFVVWVNSCCDLVARTVHICGDLLQNIDYLIDRCLIYESYIHTAIANLYDMYCTVMYGATRINLMRRQLCAHSTKVAASLCAGGIIYYAATRIVKEKHKPVIDQGADISSYLGRHSRIDPVTNQRSWADGVAPPIYDARNTFLSPDSKTCGNVKTIRDVEERFGKYVGYARISSDLNMDYKFCASENTYGCNGYLFDKGIFIMNRHTFRVDINSKPEWRFVILFSPRLDVHNNPTGIRDMNVEVNVVNGHIENVPSYRISHIEGTDLVAVKLQTPRNGLRKYVAQNHKFAASNPFILVRDNCGVLHYKDVSEAYIRDNGTYDNLDIKHHIVGNVETLAGNSGCPLFINTGHRFTDVGVRDSGYISLVGHLYGYEKETGRRLFPLYDDAMYQAAIDKICSNVSTIPQSAYAESILANLNVGVSNHVYGLSETLNQTHFKSCFSMLREFGVPCVNIFGGIKNHVASSPTKYVISDFSARLNAISKHDVLGDLTNDYLPTHIPNGAIRSMVHTRTAEELITNLDNSVPQELLDKAAMSYIDDFIERLKDKGEKCEHMRTFSIMDAINGVPEVFSPLNFSTGGGTGYPGAKGKYFNHVVAGENDPFGYSQGTSYRVPNDALVADIMHMDDQLRSGIDPLPLFTSHIKDEVRSKSKVQDCKIRVMNGSPLPLTILMRRYLMGIVLVMFRNKLESECAVGMNCESHQWTQFGDYLKEFGDLDRFLDGDYIDFDKKQKINVSATSADVMYALILSCCTLNGKQWDSRDLLAARTLLTSINNPVINFFSTIIQALGTNPSGHSLTTQKNCISNSLYMRCSFYKHVGVHSHVKYRDCVRQVNYGDDVIMSVKKDYSWFHHGYIQQTLASWGIPYTRADKEEVRAGFEYTPFSEVQFLKRRFEYNDEVKGLLAPIDPKAIVKGLHYYCRGVLSPEQHHVEILRNISQLALSYGRDKYDDVILLMRDIATHNRSANSSEMVSFLNTVGFVTFDEFIDRYHRNSVGVYELDN